VEGVSVYKSDPSGAGGVAARRGDAPKCEGTPMRVLALDPGGGTLARCAGIDGVPATIETALLDAVEPGAIVLVQGGIALARLDSEWVP
jgi:hydrogenase maturation factor